MRITGPQIKEFRDALLEAFSPEEFDDMLLFQLNIRRSDFTHGSGQRTIVREFIEAMNRQYRVDELLRAARLSNPRDPGLQAFAQKFGRAISIPSHILDARTLEQTIRQANPMLDSAWWRTQLAKIENRVCRIEIPTAPPDFGTGFLIGPDVVMTNYHVMKRVIKGQVAPTRITLRFDYALMADGVTPQSGTEYRLAQQDWLIDHSEYSSSDLNTHVGDTLPQPNQLDYALLRVTGMPGDEPVGGQFNRDHDALPRGWIELPTEPHHFEPDTTVSIVQHPDTGPLKLAFDTNSVIGVNENGTRVRYRTNTEPGSSGSPCFDINWNLIALHQCGDQKYKKFYKPQYNQGIPLTAILNCLEYRNKMAKLGKQ